MDPLSEVILTLSFTALRAAHKPGFSPSATTARARFVPAELLRDDALQPHRAGVAEFRAGELPRGDSGALRVVSHLKLWLRRSQLDNYSKAAMTLCNCASLKVVTSLVSRASQ